MGHALVNFLLTTVSMIALLYLVYLYIRGHVNIKPMQNKAGEDVPSLYVESMVGLEPRKKLYVVRSGNERFMVASSMDRLELVASLKPVVDPNQNDRIFAAIQKKSEDAVLQAVEAASKPKRKSKKNKSEKAAEAFENVITEAVAEEPYKALEDLFTSKQTESVDSAAINRRYVAEQRTALTRIAASFSPVAMRKPNTQIGLGSKAGFKERFQQSVRMVLADRLGGMR